jgi:hypothetical protein
MKAAVGPNIIKSNAIRPSDWRVLSEAMLLANQRTIVGVTRTATRNDATTMTEATRTIHPDNVGDER